MDILENSIIQILITVFLGLFSYDVIKSYIIRPKVNILVYDIQNGNTANKKRSYHLKNKFPFFYFENHHMLTLSGKEFVIQIQNEGKSTAKGLYLSGWIPSDWKFELTGEGDLKGQLFCDRKDWIKKMDKYHHPKQEEDQHFRISGKLLPTHFDYIKFLNCKPDYDLEFVLSGENIFHKQFQIEIVGVEG